jgi:signal transduction histidine kinase/PAS domain-containing protein
MASDSSLTTNQQEHSQLVNALRESEILRELAALLTSSLDLAHVLRILTKRTTEVCEVERCAVWLLDGTQLRPATYHFSGRNLKTNLLRAGDAAWRKSVIPLNSPVVQRLFASFDGMLMLKDLRTEPGMAFLAQKFLVRSILLIALVRDGRPVGMMALDNPKQSFTFSPEQQQLAHAIAQQATIAIDHAQLYQHAQAEHKRAEALIGRARSIYKVAKSVNSGEQLSTILQCALNHLLYHLKADVGSIALLEDEKLRFVATVPQELLATVADTSPSERAITNLPHCIQAAHAMIPLFVTAQETESIERQWYSKLSLQNSMIVPLLLGSGGNEAEIDNLPAASTPVVPGGPTTHCIGFIFVAYAQSTPRPSSGYSAFAQDIAAQCALAIEKDRILTEAHQAVALATERANTLDAVFGAMTEGIMVLDLDGQITTRNATAAHFVGMKQHEKEHISEFLRRFPTYTLEGQPIPPEDFPLARALRGDLAHAERFITHRVDGSERAVEVNVAELLDAQQQKMGFVGVFRDVTEQIRVERRLRRALDTMLHAVEAVSGVTDSKIILHNVLEMALQTLGGGHGVLHLYSESLQSFTPQLAMSFATEAETHWFDEELIPSAEEAERYAHLHRLLVIGHTILIKAEDCPYHPASSASTKLLAIPLLRNNHLLGMMTLDRVVTPPRQEAAGATFETSNQKVREFTVWDMALAEGIAQIAALALDEARWQHEATAARLSEAEMRASNQFKDEFIEITAHEFRNPISVILVYSQYISRFLNRGIDASMLKSLREFTTNIENQAHQLEHIVNSLLEVTRLNKRQITLDLQELDLAEIVEQAIAINRAMMQGGTIHYQKMERALPYRVQGDSARLAQIMDNLLQNALKYNLPGRDITVTLKQRTTEQGRRIAEVCVADQGIGVPKASQAHLFERFYRASNVEGGKTRGVGLGLYIVAELLRLHHGNIRVESSGVHGEGSRFIFTLPLVESDQLTSDRT